ncbi:hypothetical protein RJ639_012280 [Escallonia herrerae]|uniref:Uncharacterized protein n=1 Tax=Escallonia herrerae TaxID=1293975 RepID=A0AA88VLN1_9ASTE|nr:hypothetical protein RJ639_012280 [Escallonia herrerae]
MAWPAEQSTLARLVEHPRSFQRTQPLLVKVPYKNQPLLIKLIFCGGAIEKLIMMDTSYDMAKMCNDAEKNMPHENIETSFIVGDEEFLPIKDSNLIIYNAEMPNMFQFPSRELRVACTVAQMEREGGVSPRVSPLAQMYGTLAIAVNSARPLLQP